MGGRAGLPPALSLAAAEEGTHPLSCSSYSPPLQEDPGSCHNGDQHGLDSSARGGMLVSVCHHAHSVSHCAFDKAFLRMAPQEGSLHRRQAGTPTETELGVTGLPRKIEDTSVSGIRPQLQHFPHCRLFKLCSVARLSTPGLQARHTRAPGSASFCVRDTGEPCQPERREKWGAGM